MLDDRLLFPRVHAHAEVFRNFPRDLLLQHQNIGQLALIMRAPELTIVLGVHQLNVDQQIVVSLSEPSLYDGPDSEFASHFLCVPPLPRVAVNPQLRCLGKVIHQGLREALTQVVGFRTGSRIHQRQHSHGIKGRGNQQKVKTERDRDEQQCRHNRGHPSWYNPNRFLD